VPVLIFNPIEGIFEFVNEPGEGGVAGEEPTGAKNGVNKDFTTADFFIHEVAGRSVKVYLNGVRQNEGVGCDYTVTESGGVGTGYDTIVFDVAPIAIDLILVDYWKRA